jgi:adenylate cyclase
MKPALLAVVTLLPLLSAAGFIRMMRAVKAKSVVLAAPDPIFIAHRLALDVWRHDLVTVYSFLIISAFVAGQLRNGLERRRLRKISLNS